MPVSQTISLDTSQRTFAQSDAKNIRLLAPAGCGKTFSLLHRCLHLAKTSRTQKPRFLVFTFTVAAKAELLTRLSEDPSFKLVRDNITATTLNSYGYTRIRNAVSSHKLVSTKDDYYFTMLNQLRPIWMKHPNIAAILEGKKRSTVTRQILNIIDEFKSLGFDHTRHTNQALFLQRTGDLRKQGLEPRLSKLVDQLTEAGVIPTKTTRLGDEVARASDRELYTSFFQFWREATDHLIASSTFTLEDQKYFAYIDEQAKLEKGSYLAGAAKYDYVLVDEFQDINPLDLALVKAIADRNRADLTIVGDDDQAIFEWRGATPEYILNPGDYFQRKFETFILSTNYRSPRNVVSMSKALIEHNTRRVPKQIVASSRDDAEVDIVKTNGLNEALDLVLDVIKKTVAKKQSPARVAIIGRKKSQIIPYQIYLASQDIPFCAAEDLQVFMSKAFDRLLELLLVKSRAQSKSSSMEVLESILKLCDLVKRWPLSKGDRGELKQFLVRRRASTPMDAAEALREYTGPMKGTNAGGKMSAEVSDAIVEFFDAATVSEALLVLGSHFEGLQIDLGKAEDDIFYADPPFLQLAEYATRYGCDYDAFVGDVELAREQLVYVPPFEEDKSGGAVDDLLKRPVHLMTALRAKGKEFDTVILLDVNEGIWPSKYAKTVFELEAERRVFYVAFTRVKRKLILLVANRFGQRAASPSPYLTELT